jgi:hypothetical protein
VRALRRSAACAALLRCGTELGVERLLAETACQPYLLQLTAYDLTRRLNDAEAHSRARRDLAREQFIRQVGADQGRGGPVCPPWQVTTPLTLAA